jgi:predicted RNA-binding protein YlqC (UPF0109 family)
MKDLVEYVAKALAEHPDQVEVLEVEPGRLELRVDSSDLGRLIGRRGKTAQALRTLLRRRGPGGESGFDLQIAGRTEPDSE